VKQRARTVEKRKNVLRGVKRKKGDCLTEAREKVIDQGNEFGVGVWKGQGGGGFMKGDMNLELGDAKKSEIMRKGDGKTASLLAGGGYKKVEQSANQPGTGGLARGGGSQGAGKKVRVRRRLEGGLRKIGLWTA